jgi:hypothetical protein
MGPGRVEKGYVWNMDLYTGRKAQTEVGMTKNVVLQLCQPLFNLGHHVYMDNYFSLPELFCILRDNQMGPVEHYESIVLECPR